MTEAAALGTREEFFHALQENRDREPAAARAAVAEEIADAAEAFGDRAVLVSALVEQMSAYHGNGESVKYPVTFARLLRLWDEAPEDFDRYEAHQVFWFFKWVASGLMGTPEVPLASIRGWIDEMARRYQAAGEGPQPVYAQKYHVADQLGEGVELAYELWTTRGRTRLSDCEACEARSRAHYHFDRGEDERGLAELAPTLAGKASCSEEPQCSQAAALLPFVRLGRLDEARTAHLAGYRAVRGRDSEVAEVGRHLEFCALTGNEPRGLELLAQNRELFGYKGSQMNRLSFLTGVEVLLRRLVDTGHGGSPCPGPVGREWTVAGLRAEIAAEADALAARFDARNGTDAVTRGRVGRLTREPLVAELNLGVRAAVLPGGDGTSTSGASPSAASASAPSASATPASAADASSSAASLSAVVAASGGGSGARPAYVPTPVPADFAELLDLARTLDRQAHPDARRLWAAAAERAAGPDAAEVDALARGELAFERAYLLHRDHQAEQARAAFEEAAEWYERAGRPPRVLASRARVAWSAATAGERAHAERVAAADAAWPTLVALTEELDALRAAGFGDAEDLAEDARRQHLVIRQCRVLVARSAVLTGTPDDPDLPRWLRVFEDECDALIAEGMEFGSPLRASLAYEVRGEYLGTIDDFEASERESRAAVRLFEENGMPWRLHRPRMMVAVALASRGELAEAALLLRAALAEAHPAVEPEELTPLMRVLGDVLMQTGEFASATRIYAEAALRLDREGEVAEAVQTRWRMSKGLMAQGKTADAVAVLETLVETELPDDEVPSVSSAVPVAVSDVAASDDVASDGAASDGAAAPPTDSTAPTFFEPTRSQLMMAQLHVDLGQGLLELDEPRAAAVEYLKVADLVAHWTDQSRLTVTAAKAALALALSGNWDASSQALSRARAANETAPALPDLIDVLRDLASAHMRAHGEDGFEPAMALLAEADALRDDRPEVARSQFVSVEYDQAQVLYVRGKVLLSVDRAEEALTAFDQAITHFDHSGHPATSDRFEAVRMAAITELNHLSRPEAARSRLTKAVAEATQAGHRHAAEVLTRLRDTRH